jgi:hypothetical protein
LLAECTGIFVFIKINLKIVDVLWQAGLLFSVPKHRGVTEKLGTEREAENRGDLLTSLSFSVV